MNQLTSDHDRIRLARAFIDRHYDTPITVERISREAGFSPYHFIRLFRAAFRKTPHQYLVQRRIDRAKELLGTSSMSIYDVCFAVGFESLGSFSTLFRREAGLSPSAYRRSASAKSQAAFIPLCYRFKHSLD